MPLAASAQAATLTVDSAADGGAGSLRDAITEANQTPQSDQIELSQNLGTIVLQRRLPAITAPLAIEGPGAGDMSLDGDGSSGLLELELTQGGEVKIAGITLHGGAASVGGAIAGSGADLVLDHTALTANRATGTGGAVDLTGGSLTLLSSRFEENTAGSSGGAIALHGAGMNVVGSTISGNTASGDGGGIFVAASSGGLLIEGSKISGNRAEGHGGGLLAESDVAPALHATTIENNTSGKGGPEGVFPGSAQQSSAATSPRKRAASIAPASAGSNGTPHLTLAAMRANPILANPLAALTPQVAGPVATLLGGIALAPPDAPPAIKAAIAAANSISHTPYVWGGGHGSWYSAGYDCSGAVSFALHGAGFLSAPLASGPLEAWGAPGPGRWITVYANATHAYAVIAGLRWDTVGDASGSGPRWHVDGAYPQGFVARHFPGY